MFKIGEFSKISQVSMRSLRHYDEIGLLKPAHIDPFTGYRYYRVDQLPRLNRLIALKDLGLSLEQIGQLLDEDVPANELRGMLRLKQAELRQHVSEEQARLVRVETRLKQIEQEGKLPDYDPVIKKVAAQKVLSIREVAPNLAQMGELLFEAHRAVRQQGIDGVGVAVFYDDQFEEQRLDWEVGFAVDAGYTGQIALDSSRSLTIHELPEIPMTACVIYRGSYIGLHQGYSALGMWIAQNGYQIAGVGREVFLHIGTLDNQAANVTEIQFPVKSS